MGINELVESKGYKKFMTKLYGWGAAVVILGALFKIQHYPGASPMLVVGLGTEAMIFFFSAFEPLHEELDWTLVYPELAGMGKIEDELGSIPEHEKKKSALEKFDEMIEKAEITPGLFDKLGIGMMKLSETTEKLHDVTDATAATNNYVTNFEKASEKVLEFTSTYTQKASSISQSADSLSDSYLKTADIVNTSANEFAKQVTKSGQEILNNTSTVHLKSTETLSNAANDFAEIIHKTGSEANNIIVKTGQEFTNNMANAHTKTTETLQHAADNLAEIIEKTGTEVQSSVAQSGQNLANAYEKLAHSMNEEIGKSTTGNKSYGEQLEYMTKNLTALNAVYELQLQGSNEHIEVSKQLFKGMDEMMTNLTEAIDDSKKYKTEVSKLGQNLSALNTVYGNMLSAMNFKNANS